MSVRVFISATTRDLGSIRKIARDALLGIDYHPIEQTDFPPDFRTVNGMLEDVIRSCDAVVHIVGRRYGFEPDFTKLPPTAKRRSFTQLEYDLARKLKKKTYVFLCPEDFPYDDEGEPEEPPELVELQMAHRREILKGDYLQTQISSGGELALKLRQLKDDLAKTRRTVKMLVTLLIAIAAFLGVISFGTYRIWKDNQQLTESIEDPGVLAERMRQEIRAKSEQKLAEVREASGAWQEIRKLERRRDVALERVDDIVSTIQKGLDGGSEPVFVEAYRILSNDGSEAAIQYLESHQTSLMARLDLLNAQEESVREKKREALEPILLKGDLHEAALEWGEAREAYAYVTEVTPWWSRALRMEGRLLVTLGEFENAETRLRNAVETAADDEERSDALFELGRLLNETAEYEEAETSLTEVLRMREDIHGEDDPLVGVTVQRLAETYVAVIRFDDAEPLLKRALAIAEQAHGPDDLNVAAVAGDLAYVYRRQARFEEAEPLFQRALSIQEKALGPEHPVVAETVDDLAVMRFMQGRLKEAEGLFLRALSILENAFASTHPDVTDSMDNLALLYQQEGRYNEAESLYKNSLEQSEQILGPDHPDVATRLNNLGVLYRRQERFDDAEEMLEKSLAIKEKVYGKDHRDYAVALNNLGNAYQAQGRFDDAERLYKESLAIRERMGSEYWEVVFDLKDLGTLYRDKGAPEEAEPYFEKAISILEKTVGSEHPRLARYFYEYSRNAYALGKVSEAIQLSERALAIYGLQASEGNDQLPEKDEMVKHYKMILSQEKKLSEKDINARVETVMSSLVPQ